MKYPFLLPFTVTEYHTPEISLPVISSYHSEKPNVFITAAKKFHEILSYGLAMSSFITIFPPMFGRDIPYYLLSKKNIVSNEPPLYKATLIFRY